MHITYGGFQKEKRGDGGGFLMYFLCGDIIVYIVLKEKDICLVEVE